MLDYYYSVDLKLKRIISIVASVLIGIAFVVLIIVAQCIDKAFVCFMIFLAFCFFTIIFSVIVYLLGKKGLN